MLKPSDKKIKNTWIKKDSKINAQGTAKMKLI